MIKISQACEPIMACDRHWRGLRGSLTFLLVFLAPFNLIQLHFQAFWIHGESSTHGMIIRREYKHFR